MTGPADEIEVTTGGQDTLEALRISEIRYRRLFETARDGILILDALTRKITDVNPFMVELLGYPRDELLGKELFEIGLLKDAAASAEAFRELQENGYIRYEDLPLQTKWGKRREVEFVSNVYAENGHQVIQCNIRDITERKRGEMALREVAKRCRFVAEFMPQKIFTTLANGEVDYFNGQWMEFAGLSALQMKHAGWTHFVHPDDAAENLRLWNHSLETGLPFQCEHRFRRADGVYRWHLSHARAMSHDDGHVLMWISSNTDIDDQKKAQQELNRLVALEKLARGAAEAANRTKDEFLATVSHELRTPLTVILGWSGSLLYGNCDAKTTARALKNIERNAELQAQIIEDILDVSLIVSGKFRLESKPVRLASVIGDAIDSGRMAADAKSIEVAAFLDPDVGLVAGDANRLQQVMSNLLANAFKFTPQGGRVEVRLERWESLAQITVCDNGKGIAKEFLPFVFDSFRQANGDSTRKYSGLGLGLSIVRNIVWMHGGSVHAKSPGEGQGATFTVTIPLSLAIGAEKALPDNVGRRLVDEGVSYAPPEFVGVRILIVDDEADTLEMLCAIMEQRGAEVKSSSSAQEALAITEHWQPDLLLSDIAMPDQDGYWLISQVRGSQPAQSEPGQRLKAVALTAYVNIADRVRVLEAGFDMFVPKPVNPTELLAVIASLIPSTTASD